MIGKIAHLFVDPGSGLALVEFEDRRFVPISSGFGLRQLMDALQGDFHGRTIDYEVDSLGVMLCFEVVD